MPYILGWFHHLLPHTRHVIVFCFSIINKLVSPRRPL